MSNTGEGGKEKVEEAEEKKKVEEKEGQKKGEEGEGSNPPDSDEEAKKKAKEEAEKAEFIEKCAEQYTAQILEILSKVPLLPRVAPVLGLFRDTIRDAVAAILSGGFLASKAIMLGKDRLLEKIGALSTPAKQALSSVFEALQKTSEKIDNITTSAELTALKEELGIGSNPIANPADGKSDTEKKTTEETITADTIVKAAKDIDPKDLEKYETADKYYPSGYSLLTALKFPRKKIDGFDAHNRTTFDAIAKAGTEVKVPKDLKPGDLIVIGEGKSIKILFVTEIAGDDVFVAGQKEKREPEKGKEVRYRHIEYA